MRRVVWDAEVAQHREGLGRERFVQLDDVHLAIVRPAWASTLRVAGTGPIPMTRGATPATAPAT